MWPFKRKQSQPFNPISRTIVQKVIKTGGGDGCGHCYDGMGYNTCHFWGGHGTEFGPNSEGESRCLLFGGAKKDASQALRICDQIYGRHYEGAA